jgi:protoheme IX farnesyltransferase
MTFKYSINYLMLLFLVMLVDHYLFTPGQLPFGLAP